MPRIASTTVIVVCLGTILAGCTGRGADDYDPDDNVIEKRGKDVGAVFEDGGQAVERAFEDEGLATPDPEE